MGERIGSIGLSLSEIGVLGVCVLVYSFHHTNQNVNEVVEVNMWVQ